MIKMKTSTQKQMYELELKLMERVSKSEERCRERFLQERKAREDRNTGGSKRESFGII